MRTLLARIKQFIVRGCARRNCVALLFLCLILAVVSCAKPPTGGDAGRRAMAQANRLRATQQAASLRQAIEKYQEALMHWRRIGDRRESSRTLKLIGDVYQEFGEFGESPSYYAQALQDESQIKDPSLEIEICNGLSRAYTHLGNNDLALQYGRRALDLSQQNKNFRGEAEALNNQGEISYALGDKDAALNSYLKALSIWRNLGDVRGQAQTLLYAGYVYSDLSATQQAFDHYNQSLELWRSLNDQRGRGLTLLAMAHLQSKLGEKQEALNLYDQSLSLIKTVGDQYWEASNLMGTGVVYSSLGEDRSALIYYNQARSICRRLGLRRDEADAAVTTGDAYYLIGDYQQAIGEFNAALKTGEELADKKLELAALRSLGKVYRSLGERNRSLERLEQALQLSRSIGARLTEISTLNNIGEIHLASGRENKAFDYFKQALGVSQAWCNLNGEAQTLFNLARLESDRNNLVIAQSYLERSMNISESLRTKVAIQDLRATYFASIRQRFQLYIELLMRRHKLSPPSGPSSGLDALALEQSERARARSLLEELTDARADFLRWGDPLLIERLRKVQQQINALAEEKMRRLKARAPEDETIAMGKELTALIIERDQVEAQIRARKPFDPNLTQPQPASLKEIQQLLDDDTLLLEFSLGEARSYLWLVGSHQFKSYLLPGRAEIEKEAESVYRLISKIELKPGQTNRQYENEQLKSARALSDKILGPVAEELGNKRLLIVTDGFLQYIPFQLLPDPGSKTVPKTLFQPLLINHEIVNLPSASTLTVLRHEIANRRPASKTIAVFADPVFELNDLRFSKSASVTPSPALPQISTVRSSLASDEPNETRAAPNFQRLHWAGAEADAISSIPDQFDREVWRGFEANRARAVSPELSQFRIIHFATHGTLNTDHPQLSAIVLSLYDQNGRPREGFLRLHEIYNLNLPADLIVLSACETALGREIKGEGLIGLTRGFMHAGAARVMASLWKVEDRSTAELMKHFYTFLLRDKMTPAQALRLAQIEVWKQPNYSSPYHWAGFVLQGEYR